MVPKHSQDFLGDNRHEVYSLLAGHLAFVVFIVFYFIFFLINTPFSKLLLWAAKSAATWEKQVHCPCLNRWSDKGWRYLHRTDGVIQTWHHKCNDPSSFTSMHVFLGRLQALYHEQLHFPSTHWKCTHIEEGCQLRRRKNELIILVTLAGFV